MEIQLTNREFRLLLDMVYIGNWVLNSTRGEDRFQEYDDLESKIFGLCRGTGFKALVEQFDGVEVPSQAYAEGGIHEAIGYYEDNVFYEILAEELSRSAGIPVICHTAEASIAPQLPELTVWPIEICMKKPWEVLPTGMKGKERRLK